MVAVLVATSGVVLAADRYKLNVTRKDSNVYKVDGTSYWIKSRYCYEYSYGQEAILVWEAKGSYSNKLVFVEIDGSKNTECDVESLLIETEPK